MKVSTIASKRRRRELTAKRRQKNTTSEVQEGSTYQSGISLIDTIDIIEIPPPVPEEKNVSDFWCQLTMKQPFLENAIRECNYLAQQVHPILTATLFHRRK